MRRQIMSTMYNIKSYYRTLPYMIRNRLLDMIYVSKDQHQRTNNDVQFNFFLQRPNSVYNQLTGENDILAIR